MAEDLTPEWCIVANLLPYPYGPDSPLAEFRSQKMFPAGAKLYVIGGFAGLFYESISVVGFPHRGRRPVMAHIGSRYAGGWRARLVYRPAILRVIQEAARDEYSCHRWLGADYPYEGYPKGTRLGFTPTDPAYGEHLSLVAAAFQRMIHGTGG